MDDIDIQAINEASRRRAGLGASGTALPGGPNSIGQSPTAPAPSMGMPTGMPDPNQGAMDALGKAVPQAATKIIDSLSKTLERLIPDPNPKP